MPAPPRIKLLWRASAFLIPVWAYSSAIDEARQRFEEKTDTLAINAHGALVALTKIAHPPAAAS